MTARRSASLIELQVAISSRVRPQPVHSPDSESSRQTLTQGVSKAGYRFEALKYVSMVL